MTNKNCVVYLLYMDELKICSRKDKCVADGGSEQPLTNFYRDSSRPDGIRPLCKTCTRLTCNRWLEKNKQRNLAQAKIYRDANKDKARKYYEDNRERLADYAKKRRVIRKDLIRETKRKYRTLNRFKVALTQSYHAAKKYGYKPCSASIELLSKAFSGVCDICGIAEEKCDKKLHLDHCHASGDFRGWLCRKCNSMIGNALDKTETLVKGIWYLKFNWSNR